MNRDEDEIEQSAAPLLEHLIELRRRLIWAILAFFVAFIFCFAFAKQLFNLLVVPYQWAIDWAGMDRSKAELIDLYRTSGILLHAGEGGHVRRHCAGLPGHRRTDL